ncbi:DNA repair protein RecO [Patescibacteria group bacterium]|nr:DNA repair protein RecO [Patescibacteria group bacterium]
MAVHYRTQGFVLKKTDLREADQVFSIYTQDFGKLEILGKAIRKIKSKLRLGAELFYLSETEFIQGKTYKTLTDAIVIDKFKNIRSDLERLKIAYQIAETADNLISGQEKDEKIWNLLNEVFDKLENYELRIKNYGLIYLYFIWNLLSILGYQIDLYNCAVCQKKLVPQKLYFNPEEGGTIDLECFKKIEKGEEVSPELVKILRLLLKKDWNILSRLKIQDLHKKELENISENYISFYKQGA